MNTSDPFAAPTALEFPSLDSVDTGPPLRLFLRWFTAWMFISLSGAVFGLTGAIVGVIVGGIVATIVGLIVTLVVFGAAAVVFDSLTLNRYEMWVNGLCGALTGTISVLLVMAGSAGPAAIAFALQNPQLVLEMAAAAGVGAVGGIIPVAFRLTPDVSG